MSVLVVVDDPRDWQFEVPGIEVVSARAYLTDPAFGTHQPLRLFNLCKSYRYKQLGYYVSLLAEARGHKPLPRVGTMEDLQSRNLVRLLTEDMDEMIQRLLSPLKSDAFELSIYFGRNVSRRYDALAHKLFSLFQAPFMRAEFERRNSHWRMRGIHAIGTDEIPSTHRDFVLQAAAEYFTGRGYHPRKRTPPRFDLAILHDPDNPEPPSNARAMEKFRKAAESLGMHVEFITRGDFHRLPGFDALFIRETTYPNHYTYRFSRSAASDGMVVIDDPESILRCNNKVYIAELLTRHKVPVPKTLVVHRDNIGEIIPRLGLPCVLKQPDSSFSKGVVKVETEKELLSAIPGLLTDSDLVIAQEWLPTEFDWRVGILDRRVLFVAKYVFPRGHWQIIQRDEQRRKLKEGPTIAVDPADAPSRVVKTALRAANLIGDGFYGVDVKQVGSRVYVIEINDNPNVDAGNEDGVLKDALYLEVMGVFLKRIEARKRASRK